MLVRSDLKGQGLGTLLMRKLIACCRERCTRRLCGSVMSDNTAMLQLARSLGFRVSGREGNIEEVTLELLPAPTLG